MSGKTGSQMLSEPLVRGPESGSGTAKIRSLVRHTPEPLPSLSSRRRVAEPYRQRAKLEQNPRSCSVLSRACCMDSCLFHLPRGDCWKRTKLHPFTKDLLRTPELLSPESWHNQEW